MKRSKTKSINEVPCWKCKKNIPFPKDDNILNTVHTCPLCGAEYTFHRIPSYSYFTMKVFDPMEIYRNKK